jgi:hypothetical protein
MINEYGIYSAWFDQAVLFLSKDAIHRAPETDLSRLYLRMNLLSRCAIEKYAKNMELYHPANLLIIILTYSWH